MKRKRVLFPQLLTKKNKAVNVGKVELLSFYDAPEKENLIEEENISDFFLKLQINRSYFIQNHSCPIGFSGETSQQFLIDEIEILDSKEIFSQLDLKPEIEKEIKEVRRLQDMIEEYDFKLTLIIDQENKKFVDYIFEMELQNQFEFLTLNAKLIKKFNSLSK